MCNNPNYAPRSSRGRLRRIVELVGGASLILVMIFTPGGCPGSGSDGGSTRLPWQGLGSDDGSNPQGSGADAATSDGGFGTGPSIPGGLPGGSVTGSNGGKQGGGNNGGAGTGDPNHPGDPNAPSDPNDPGQGGGVVGGEIVYAAPRDKQRATFRNRAIRLRLETAPETSVECDTQGVVGGSLSALEADPNAPDQPNVRCVVFTPTRNFEGDASFSYRGTANGNYSDWGRYSLKVTKPIIGEMWLNGDPNYDASRTRSWSLITDQLMIYFVPEEHNITIGWDYISGFRPAHLQVIPAFLPWLAVRDWCQGPGQGSNFFVERSAWVREPNHPGPSMTVADAVNRLAAKTGSNQVLLDNEIVFTGSASTPSLYYFPPFPPNFVEPNDLNLNDPATAAAVANLLANSPWTGCPGIEQHCRGNHWTPGQAGQATECLRLMWDKYQWVVYDCSVARWTAAMYLADPSYCTRIPAFNTWGARPSLEDTLTALRGATGSTVLWFYDPFILINNDNWRSCGPQYDLQVATEGLVHAIYATLGARCRWLVPYAIYPCWQDESAPEYSYQAWKYRRQRHVQLLNQLGGNASWLCDQMWVTYGPSCKFRWGMQPGGGYGSVFDGMRSLDSDSVSFFVGGPNCENVHADDPLVLAALVEELNPDHEPWSMLPE